MKSTKKYHRGGNMPTPPGQVPHSPIGRGNRPRNLREQVVGISPEEAALRKRIQQARRMESEQRKRLRSQPMPMPIQQPRPIRGAVPVQATPQPMPTQRQQPVARRTPLRPESTTVVPPSGRRSTGTPKPQPRISPIEQAKQNSELLKRLAQGNLGTSRTKASAKRSTGTPRPVGRGRVRRRAG